MRVLAIDSSGLTATVAIVEDDTTIAEFTINYKKTHSQTLLPMIDEMVKMVEADLNTIDAIAVANHFFILRQLRPFICYLLHFRDFQSTKISCFNRLSCGFLCRLNRFYHRIRLNELNSAFP